MRLRRKQVYLAGFLLLIAALIAFHFFAAGQAEADIDKAIQEQIAEIDSTISVQYSSIEVSPFSGGVAVSDLMIIHHNNIERSTRISLDLSYGDFLNIYFWGAEHGLSRITEASLNIWGASYLDRDKMYELKFSEARLRYNGNLLEALRSFIANTRISLDHEIVLTGKDIRYARPESSIGSFSADSLYLVNRVSASAGPSSSSSDTLSLHTVLWNPPSSFQDNYGFIIRGFGLQPDSIRAKSATFNYMLSVDEREVALSQGTVITDLGDIKLHGTLIWPPSAGEPILSPLNVSATNLKAEVGRVINNLERMLNRRLPRNENGDPAVRLQGPVSEPKFLQ